MKLFEKVYWGNGWPNNGMGKLLFTCPSFSIVIDKCGDIVWCKWVRGLEQVIREKEHWMNWEIANSGKMKDGYDLSDEIIELKKYLNK